MALRDVSWVEQVKPPAELAQSIRRLTKNGSLLTGFLLRVVSDEGRSVRDRIKAAEILFERGWGRAHQTVDLELTAQERQPPPMGDLALLTAQEREQCRQILRAAKARALALEAAEGAVE